MEGIHLKDEAICHYYRKIYKGLEVPNQIYQTIKNNEPAFISPNSEYGIMSEYRSIARNASQKA